SAIAARASRPASKSRSVALWPFAGVGAGDAAGAAMACSALARGRIDLLPAALTLAATAPDMNTTARQGNPSFARETVLAAFCRDIMAALLSAISQAAFARAIPARCAAASDRPLAATVAA